MRRVVLSAFMIALFLTVLSTEAEVQVEEFVPYIPDSSQVELTYWKQSGVSYMNITVEFPDTGFNISSWGTPNTTGNNISVDAEIWRWTGISLPIVITLSHMCSLGDLLSGEYKFFFEVWGSSIRNTTFLVSPEITVPDDYLTIQEAINAANEGDTIFVKNGKHYENVIVNKTVSLIGESKEATIIDGDEESPRPAVRLKADGIRVSNFTVQGGPVGIEFYYSRDCVLRNNEMRNNTRGNLKISAAPWDGSDYYNDVDASNTADLKPVYWWTNEANRVVPSDAGMVIAAYSHDISVKGLALCNNTDAILFYCVYNSKIESVTLYENYNAGIHLIRSWNNSITNSNISNNERHGIRLESESDNNTIARNNICSNGYGLWLRNGSSDNILFHNNIINNRILQVSDTDLNTWDNGCEGNYWSNYNGTDLDNDGIGDTYVPWEGVDSYPLMNLYWNPGDIDHDLDVDIFDVVKCGIAYGSAPADLNWNPHCDIAEPYGIINIFDIVMIATSYGEECTP